MAYSAITNAEIDQDSPLTQQLMTKYRDNPLEVFSGGSGYMNAGNWVPVDWTFGSQAGTGTIYDHAVDGATNSVDYTLEDGWEYMFLVSIEHQNFIGDRRLEVLVSQDAGSTFPAVNVQTDTVAFDTFFGGTIILQMPRVDTHPKYIELFPTDGNLSTDIITGDAVDQIRFRLSSSTNISAGTIRAFRRREYITAS